MAKNRYLPTTDAEKVAWLANFAAKIATHGATLGLTPAQIAAVAADNNVVQYVWAVLVGNRTRMQEITAFKTALFNGPATPALGAIPMGYTGGGGSPPTPGAPDVFGRIGLLVTAIKAHPAYTTAIGEDLGVEGSESTFDPQSLKPVISVRPVSGGLCEVVWTKGKASGIEIEVDRGTGSGFVFLTIDSIPNYVDTHTLPVGTASVWKYRAIYRYDDARAGEWSDIVTCAVKG